MTVVVRSSDKIVHLYVCETNASTDPNSPAFRTVTVAPGGLSWHVVGGVAPYRVLRDESHDPIGGCITVVDAEGRTATGCGVVATHEVRLAVDCREMEREDNIHGLVPNDSTDMRRSFQPVAARAPEAPVVERSPEPGTHPAPLPPRPIAPGPITYRPPVKTPAEPPAPLPPGPIKDRLRPVDHPRTAPPPQPRETGVRGDPAPAFKAHRASAPSHSGSTHSPAPAPRPVAPPPSRTPGQALPR